MGEVSAAAVVSRSGMLIDGDAPDYIHMETFGAMMAIMLGAAETATSESQDALKHINIELMSSSLVIVGAGQRILLAVFVQDKTKMAGIGPMIDEAARRLRTLV